jgi:hypothetical protein
MVEHLFVKPPFLRNGLYIELMRVSHPPLTSGNEESAEGLDCNNIMTSRGTLEASVSRI